MEKLIAEMGGQALVQVGVAGILIMLFMVLLFWFLAKVFVSQRREKSPSGSQSVNIANEVADEMEDREFKRDVLRILNLQTLILQDVRDSQRRVEMSSLYAGSGERN